MNDTTIEWCARPGTLPKTWNPIRARLVKDSRPRTGTMANGKQIRSGTFCTRISPGCTHCYASTINQRFGNGLEYTVPNLEKVEFFVSEKILQEPLKTKKPCTIFVADMFDLFHEAIPDHMILSVFEMMRQCQHHVFLMLTKRTERMSHFGVLSDYTMRHVWPGTSVENEQTARERIPLLCKTRTLGKRFLSVEPLLDAVDLRLKTPCSDSVKPLGCIDWVIVGGESGPKSRPFNLAWAKSLREQCEAADVAYFCKQLGSNPQVHSCRDESCTHPDCGMERVKLKDRKGGAMEEWPESLRIREFPA